MVEIIMKTLLIKWNGRYYQQNVVNPINGRNYHENIVNQMKW